MSLTLKSCTIGTADLKLRLSEIPSDGLTRVEHDGHEVVVIRRGERVFAYRDVCPHAFWPLSQGSIHHGFLECPGHGWEFDVETGECRTAPGYCLTPIPVTIIGQQDLAADPSPGQEFPQI